MRWSLLNAVIEGRSVDLGIADGRIFEITSSGALTGTYDNATDLGGDALFPGFIDLQINGSFGHDFVTDPESIWEVARLLPQYGVTAFLPTVITATDEAIEAAIAVLEAGPPEGHCGAEPLGLHAEGPFLAPAKKGAHDGSLMRLPTERPDWLESEHLAMVTLAPELEGALELTRELSARGILVSAGHTEAAAAVIDEAAEAGLRYGTHLYNAMSGLGHRNPGAAAGLLTNDLITCGLIADGVHFDPHMARLAWSMKGPGGINLVTDAMAAAGMPDGAYKLGDFTVQVKDGAVRLPDGTLAGSSLTLDRALRNLIRFTGCSLEDAVTTVTRTPARVLGNREVHIAAGEPATLTALSPECEVTFTMRDGRPLFD